MSVTLVRLLGIALLIAAAWNFSATLSGVPAFDRTARQDSIQGGWRLPLGSALYDRGEYLFQLGFGFANADDSISTDATAIASEDFLALALERSERAEELLAEAVTLDPANAHAWAWLAWSQSMLGETESARETMRISWELAPFNRQLAATRLDFGLLIEELAIDEPEDIPPLSDEEWGALRRDYAVLAQRGGELPKTFLELMPQLAPETN